LLVLSGNAPQILLPEVMKEKLENWVRENACYCRKGERKKVQGGKRNGGDDVSGKQPVPGGWGVRN